MAARVMGPRETVARALQRTGLLTGQEAWDAADAVLEAQRQAAEAEEEQPEGVKPGDQYDRDGDLWTGVSPGRWDCRYGAVAPLDWDTADTSVGVPWPLVVATFGPMRPADAQGEQP